MALPAYAAAGLGWLNSPDAAIIGALMLLVPGLLITNSMRDIIYGDTNSGVFRIVSVVLSALAIALGTEGDGLAHETIAGCDHTVCIPMSHGVDSLNVAAASAVAFWELRVR